MPVPLIPAPIDQLGQRRFSFYPPIVHIEHNEWMVRRSTWSEVLVMNTKSSEELWIPRQFVGEVSLVEEPVMIVGLVKELEYKAGMILPHVRRVIEMPRVVNDSFRPRMFAPEPHRPAEVVGIRIESGAESRTGRWMRGLVAAGVLACVAVPILLRVSTMGARARVQPFAGVALPLSASDDYSSIVAKLGPPSRDRWTQGDPSYERLWYPEKSVVLILLGRDREHAFYAGAVSSSGGVVHSVELPDGQNSADLIRNLR